MLKRGFGVSFVRNLGRGARFLGSVGFLALGAAQVAFADDQQVAVADQASGGVETVTVTARQRAENVQDGPIALTAISAEQLAESGIDQLSQIQYAAPSLSVY